jgi:putative transposase
MPRGARIVIPDVPHHIIQRGNRKADIFFCDEDARPMSGSSLRPAPGIRCGAWPGA